MSMQKSEHNGVVLVLLAAILYSLGGVCIKIIPWSSMSINSGRNLISLVVIGVYLWRMGHRPRFNPWIGLGALAICGTNTLFTMANKMTTAANAIVLQFTAPIFVLLLTALVWRKLPRRGELVACGVVVLGVLCFFVDSLQAGGMAGNVVALLSGFSYAGVFLLQDMPDCDPISSVFWGNVCSAVIGLPWLVAERSVTATSLVSLVVLGVFQVGLAYILLTMGLARTSAVTASLVSGIEPILNPILVALIYHETIGGMSLLGAVIVIGGVVGYNVWKTKADAAQAVPDKS
ncbi:EamA family transporter [Pseudoflavonifractor sp. An85]|uniref:DMT family transporter n=1 Tax=Pseudoflavonifractor sp. An85 TaxID=1965661 RepID=UPI000B3A6246|nr:EamA family transporter [Pseudoflavonifractor sp. An85]OUN26199.1 hypothetical protein B5G37_00255 [Pseudoflavonifractor sp. An85]